jgi:predicted RND superfamily exporter protein
LHYQENEISRPQAIADVATLVDWIKEQHPVKNVFSPLPLIQECLDRRQPPFTGALEDAPQKMMNYCVRSTGRSSGGSVGFFDTDFQQLHLKVVLPRISTKEVRLLSEKIETKTSEMGFAPESVSLSGVTVMYAYISEVNTKQMLIGSALAMLVVSLLIGLFLRSPILAVLSILPNFLPAMSSLGLWVWINGQVGMAAAVIAAVTFGIVVDDTIHILYALARGKHTQSRAGVRKVLRNVTPGVLTTTAALGLGFAFLIFSGFEVNRQLGFLTSMTIFIAFVFDIFVLPGLYSLLKGKR